MYNICNICMLYVKYMYIQIHFLCITFYYPNIHVHLFLSTILYIHICFRMIIFSIIYIPCLFIDGEFNDESTMGKG